VTETGYRVQAVEIVSVGDPVLRLGTRRVRDELFGSDCPERTRRDHAWDPESEGRRLGRAQVAVPLRLFVAEDTEAFSIFRPSSGRKKVFSLRAVVNPAWPALSIPNGDRRCGVGFAVKRPGILRRVSFFGIDRDGGRAKAGPSPRIRNDERHRAASRGVPGIAAPRRRSSPWHGR
jgi:hypothetical protein